MNNKTKTILRWIAVPFAAILSSMLIHYVFTTSARMTHGLYDPGTNVIGIHKIPLLIFRDFIVGVVFVFGGLATAPSSRYTVAVVLATIQCIMCVVSLILAFRLDYSWTELIGIIATFAGAAYAPYWYQKEESKEKQQ